MIKTLHRPPGYTVGGDLAVEICLQEDMLGGVGFSFFGRFTTYRLAFALASLAYYIPWMSYILLAWKNPERKKVAHEDSTGN